LEAVEMMYVGGDFVRAAAMRPAVEACGEGPRRTCVLGLMAFAAGRLREAESLLSETLAAVDADERLASWGTRAATNLGFARLLLGDWAGALAAAETALAGDLTWERSVSQFTVVVALTRLDRVDEARRRLVEETGDSMAANRPGTLDVLAARGMASLVDDDLTAARQDLAAVARRARAGERIRMHEFALVNLAEVDFLDGQWDEALTNVDLAISLAAESGRAWAFVSAHALGATIRAYRGRYDDAEAHLREAEAVARESDSWLSHGRTAMARASLADVRRDPQGMIDAFEQATHAPLRGRHAAAGPANWRVPIAEALVSAGRMDEAAVAVEHLSRLLAQRPLPSFQPDGARLRGLLAEAHGDDDAAAGAYEGGPDSLDGTNPVARARLALTHGAFLGRRGQRRAAVEHLRKARASFADLGATPFVERCDAELEGLGLARGTESERGPFDLTDAELRVARMVADGLSNREAAERLYISPKTVEYHLGNVYAKLGISSRWMLADRLRAPAG
jgi:ATP/maltotriose-dependent transcriptional regulator MalT